METKTKEQVEQEVRSILSFHKGKDKAITRWELVERIFGNAAAAERGNNNPFDRQVRAAIEKYRDVDLIVSSSGSSGYWAAEDMNDVLIIAEEYEKRSKTMLAKKSRIVRRGQEKFGLQIPLMDIKGLSKVE